MLPVQEHVGLLIAAARRRLKQAALSRATGHGLSAQQFWFLVAVAERPGISQAELAGSLRSDAPTVSRVVSALARRRLVRAEHDPGDRRRLRLVLTRAGERLAAQLAAHARALRTAVVAGMSSGEVDALRAGLRRVISNLERVDAAAARPNASRARGGGHT
jgi:DNA-binding MarR family transcriptional regulator